MRLGLLPAVSSWLGVLPLLLLPTATSAVEVLCRHPTDDCGLAAGLCGSVGASVERDELVTVCVGFQGPAGAAAGKKALFQVKVDHYASLTIDSLRALMGAPWAQKEPFSQVWVGAAGRRTIGQREGVYDRGSKQCNATMPEVATAGGGTSDTSSGSSAPRCYGWTVHNKPAITRANQMSSGLTAIIHLDMGVVNRIVWDSGCNLCREETTEVTCLPDQSNISCVGGECTDCYAQLQGRTCTAADEVCAPRVYVAWLGTDRHGQPLLSAGSVFSRFQQHSVSKFANKVIGEVKALTTDLAGSGGAGGDDAGVGGGGADEEDGGQNATNSSS